MERICPKNCDPRRQSECYSCSERTDGNGCQLIDDPPLEDRIAAVRDVPEPVPPRRTIRKTVMHVLLGGELQ